MKVSVIILTKDRSQMLEKALESVGRQTWQDFEILLVNDGSTDETEQVIRKFYKLNIKVIKHEKSLGITKSRQEALEAASGQYMALLDDDDEWIDEQKLQKQVKYFDSHPDCVIVGGGIEISNFQFPISNEKPVGSRQYSKFRPETDKQIRNWMLLKNPFFTSTVLFRRKEALRAGGFVKDEIDLAEDYDLWLRMGKLGLCYNFQEVFTRYAIPRYNKEKKRQFFFKQLRLIRLHRHNYPHYFLASAILRVRSAI